MNYKNPGKIEFRERLIGNGEGNLYVNFPFNVAAKFGVTSTVPVRIMFDNKIECRGDLVNNGTRCHTITIHQKISRSLGAKPGSYINISLELDKPSN